MIFLFDKFKKLKGTVRNRHTISLLYERERNGLYTVSAEIPLKITDKKTVYNYHKKVKDSDFLGHYDREGRFQLHKIASVDIEDSSIFIKGVHLFFDEAKAGAIIQERRFRQSEIIDGARVAFDSIGWSVVDFDVSDTKDYIFYNVSPLEARAILVETFGFEFDYWLDFDGKNIRNKQISVKREMGKDSNKRYNYGHNVLNIKVEQDYSEIYTAVIGRGKGEELGDDAYGRRIEYTDVVWKTPTNPMNKPKGSRTLHDENATQLFGYHEDGKVSPRTKVEIFEDIEDPAELLQASYEWLKENSVPKAVFSLKVPDGDGLDLGDKVHVIYRDIDLVKHTRVTRVIDDLVSGNRDVEFGDTAYFKTDRRLSGVKSELKRVGGSMSSRISRLKAEFDRRFDNEVQQWKDDFEQALIDAEAAVAVMRAEMTEELATVRREMTNRFESEKAAAQEEAQRNYDAISDRITTVVDTTRTEMNTAFENSVKESKAFATQEAKAKAQAVQSNLSTFETEHNQIISDFKGSVNSTFDSIGSEVQGITERLGTLRESIDETEKSLNQVGEDLGNAKTDLQKQLDAARAELDGLEVGGRNLIVNSDDLKPSSSNANVTVSKVTDGIFNNVFKSETKVAGASSYFTTIYGQVSENPKIGQKATLSLLVRGVVFEGRPNGLDIYYNSGTKNQTMGGISEEYQWLSVTFDVLSEVPSFHFYPPNFSELYIARAKLEIGNIATDWTPAPEDTEQKITNINQTITNIEGELSSKVEQTEVDALKGTVTAQGTLLTQTADEVSSKAEKSVVDTLTGRVANTESSVTQNAAEIAKKLTKSVYDSDKKATDAKITQWSNLTTETAEGLEQTISRLSTEEGKISEAQADIKANADEIALKAAQSELNSVTGRVSTAESQLSIQAGEISSIVGKVDGNIKSISSVLQDTKSIKSTVATIEKDLVSQGSEIDQALNSITSKVWLGDVGGRNLLPKTDLPNDRDYWKERGADVTLNQTSTRGLTDYLWLNRYGGEANRYIAVLSPLLTENVVEGHEYTIQFKTAHRANVNEKFSYVYLMNEDGDVNQATFDSQQTVVEIGANDYDGKQIQLHTISIKANFSGRAKILIGTHTVGSGSARFYVKEPKIEKGKATAYSRAPEDFLQMSELKITPGYWQLGSTRIDGDSVSSVLRGSPDSIDAIVSEMNLTGNLNVKGQIETIAMSAVRGDFADLFAARVKAGDVDIDNISGRTAWFERLYTLNANIEKLTAQFVFTDAIHAKSLDAIEANIGRVRTAFLKADVISGSHIKSNTIEIKHLTGYDAILEMLMARQVFSSEVTTLSLNAVEANIGSVRSQILTSNVIKSSHIAGGTALIDKIFSSNAMFERMMAKSGFVRTLNTVSIDTDQLTIRRADGGVLMSQGTQKFGSPIITKPFPDTGVEFDGTNYVTTLRSSKTFERAYGEHAGRYANFSFRIGLDWSAASASTYMRIVIRPGTTPSGVTVPLANERFIVYRGEQKSETISVRLPVPTFGAISWTLEFYREGDNATNPITVRSERCWISA